MERARAVWLPRVFRFFYQATTECFLNGIGCAGLLETGVGVGDRDLAPDLVGEQLVSNVGQGLY